MTIQEQADINKSRNYIVSKSNAIIQKSRYQLSVPEQRAIAYICSLIKPISSIDKAKGISVQLEYDFDILEYAKICGISADNGRIYEETKSLLKGLIQKVYFIPLEDGTETTVNWVNKVWTNKRSGKAKIRLDEDMIPYLFDLQGKFTSYGLYNLLRMKSQYSIRLFELFKSYDWIKSKTFEVDELKRLLMVEDIKSYSDFGKFRQKVLEPAMQEINDGTILRVSMEQITKGRKVEKVKFRIRNLEHEEQEKRKKLFEKMEELENEDNGED